MEIAGAQLHHGFDIEGLELEPAAGDGVAAAVERVELGLDLRGQGEERVVGRRQGPGVGGEHLQLEFQVAQARRAVEGVDEGADLFVAVPAGALFDFLAQFFEMAAAVSRQELVQEKGEDRLVGLQVEVALADGQPHLS